MNECKYVCVCVGGEDSAHPADEVGAVGGEDVEAACAVQQARLSGALSA